jgi:AcrR family transcriptional regulator
MPDQFPPTRTPFPTTERPVPPRGRPAPIAYAARPVSLHMRATLREIGAGFLARPGGTKMMSDMLREAGQARPSINHLYPRKHDLVFDILHSHIDGLLEHVGGAEEAEAEAPAFDRLTCMVRAYLDFVLSYRDEQVVAITLLDTLPSGQRGLLRYQLRLLAHRLALAIEAAVPSLTDAAALRRPLSLSLMAAVNATVLWFRDDGALSREDYTRLLAQQAVAGARAILGA